MKLIIFVKEIINRVKKNDLISMANALTYKLIVAIFPFVIFLMTLIAYLNIDITEFIADVSADIPEQVRSIFNTFVNEVVYTRRLGILSVSLLITVFTASSGFYSFIKGLNRAYGTREHRGYIYTRFVSFFLVFIFTFTIIASIYILILSDEINNLIISYSFVKEIPKAFRSVSANIIIILIMYFTILLVYKIGADIKTSFLSIIPGTVFTASAWLVLSKLFNLYIDNFSKISVVYGSIGSMFVFMFWLNMLSYVLLIGCQINAILNDKKWMDELFRHTSDKGLE